MALADPNNDYKSPAGAWKLVLWVSHEIAPKKAYGLCRLLIHYLSIQLRYYAAGKALMKLP